MKTMKIITIVCWVVVAAVLLGFAGWFLTGTVFGSRSERWNRNMPLSINIGNLEALTGPYNAVGTYNVDAAGLNSIHIDWIAGNTTLRPYDGDQIQITEFAQRELRDNERLHYSASGDTLTIRFIEQNRGAIINMPTKKLEVLVPRELSESLESLAVDSASGGVDAEGLNPATLKVSSISGSVNLSNIVSRSIGIDSTSGSVTVADALSDTIEIESISGSVRVSGSSARAFDCGTTSGGINVSGEYGAATLKTISGRISLDNSAQLSRLETESTSGSLELWGSFDWVRAETLSGSISVRSTAAPSSLRAESTSGSITVAVPNEGSVTVNHSSVSGRFSSDIPVIMQNGDAQFVLSTISGRISIIELEG